MPASLERGLALLAILSRHNRPMSFAEIDQALGAISHASLSRLLRALLDLGYLHKDPRSGYYTCGHRMGIFASAKTEGRRPYLLARYRPLMETVSAAHDVTVILLERVQDILVNIHKVQTDISPHMQEVGTLNDEPDQPWGQVLRAFDPLLFESVTDSAQRATLRSISYQGYVYDDQTLRSHFRRIGFPLFDPQGDVIGCLGIGSGTLQITDTTLPLLIAEVRQTLERIHR